MLPVLFLYLEARFDGSQATAQDVLWIALAGPLASLVATILIALLYASAGTSGVVHDLLWTGLLTAIFGVLSVVPLTLTEGRGGPRRRTDDGRVAIDALRVMWALR